MYLVLMSFACLPGMAGEQQVTVPQEVLAVDTVPSSPGGLVDFTAEAGKGGTRLFTVRNDGDTPLTVTLTVTKHEHFRITKEDVEPPDADSIARALNAVTLTVPPHKAVTRTIIFTPDADDPPTLVHNDTLRVTTPGGVNKTIVLFGHVKRPSDSPS